MMRAIMMLPPAVLALLQAGNPQLTVAEYGVLGAMLAFVCVMWERDTRSRQKAQADSDARYSALVTQFTSQLMEVLKANTKANTRLFDTQKRLIEILLANPCLLTQAQKQEVMKSIQS